MLRVRIDGGALTAAQLRTIADSPALRPRHRRHHRPAEHPVPLDPHRGHAGDLAAARGRRPDTTEACGDTPRVVLGTPVAGVAEDEVLDPRPAIDEIIHRYIGSPEFSNLPRKFKSSISWLPDIAHEVNDISFLGVDPPRARPRLRPVGRRRPVHQPDARPAARRLGAAGRGARRLGRRHRVFRDYGYRRLRHRARLKFLVADWGVEKFREVLERST